MPVAHTGQVFMPVAHTGQVYMPVAHTGQVFMPVAHTGQLDIFSVLLELEIGRIYLIEQKKELFGD
jgi:hypothetical protein